MKDCAQNILPNKAQPPSLSLQDIAQVLEASFSGEDKVLSGVSTDTRTIADGSLFVALTGESFDGHDYLETAFAQGAYAAVVSRSYENKGQAVLEQYPFFFVEDTRLALLKIAGLWRHRWQGTVVAVSGSVGKTTTRDMTALVLESKGKTLKTKANLNNEIGLSQMLLSLTSDYTMACLELGIDGPGQMEPMALAAAPQVAVITNIGDSHLAAFDSVQNISDEKLALAKGLPSTGTLVLNGDDPLLNDENFRAPTTLFYGIYNKECHVLARNIITHGWEQHFIICYQQKEYTVALPAVGEHNVYNALAAFAAGIAAGVSPPQAAKALEEFVPTGMRQKRVSFQGMTVVEDCYNSSPQSLRRAMEALADLQPQGKKIAVLADMLELGEQERELHQSLGEYIGTLAIDIIYTTGTLGADLAKGAIKSSDGQVRHFPTKEPLAQALLEQASPGDILWCKASRGMRLEDVMALFYKEREQ